MLEGPQDAVALGWETPDMDNHISQSNESEGAEPLRTSGGHGRDRAGNRIDRFGTGDIGKIMLEFAVPAVIGVIMNGLYNVIDSIFLGHGVGELGLAATTVAMPTMTIFLALSMLVGIGGNALAAIKLGEGKKDDAEKVLGNAFTLLLIFGVIVAIIGTFFIDPLLWVSGATTESIDLSRQFMQIICLGFVFQATGMGMNNFIRTAGAPNRALLTMVIGTVACIAFNYLFVIVLHWGVQGSAAATVFGQAISASTVVAYFVSHKAPFRLHVRNLRLDRNIAGNILTLGLAPFALQCAAAIVTVVLNNMLVLYGAQSAIGSEGALAAIGVVQKVAMFIVFPVIGISQAAQPLLGYNYGARDFARVKKTLKTAMLWATYICLFFTVLVQVFPVAIVALFGVKAELLDFTGLALRIYMFATPIIGMQIIGSNYFQSTGQPFKAMLLTLTRQIIFLLPTFYFMPKLLPLIFPSIEPVLAICYAAPVSDTLSFVLTIIFVIREVRRLTHLQDAGEKVGTQAA